MRVSVGCMAMAIVFGELAGERDLAARAEEARKRLDGDDGKRAAADADGLREGRVADLYDAVDLDGRRVWSVRTTSCAMRFSLLRAHLLGVLFLLGPRPCRDRRGTG